MEIRYAKGHTGGNDFLLLLDQDARIELTAAAVRAICDRFTGLGADGILRLVPVESTDSAAAWFMDCRNADGSASPMCGTGFGLSALYLVDQRRTEPGEVWIATPGGTTRAFVDGDAVSVELRSPRFLDTAKASVDGVGYDGEIVALGNTHLVCVIDTPVAELDLSRRPEFDQDRFGADLDVTFVNEIGPDRIAVRVHQAGIGADRSCATAVCAAAGVVRRLGGALPAKTTQVDAVGGTVQVEFTAERTRFSSTAALVAQGVVNQRWLDRLATAAAR
ncbi:diaminopimelate epimerase [Fodinicola feengrottensis]|uniref:Diaminopimelate epimerase n=1 Tax=Fodinicola feengrottensis TaxID=435914 RepID=A0ABN2I966_9ACTN|nr:diaminopimelate epimerase [Fodinicola feengrottensis]